MKEEAAKVFLPLISVDCCDVMMSCVGQYSRQEETLSDMGGVGGFHPVTNLTG